MKKLSVWLAIASLFTLATAPAATLVEKFATDPSLAGWQAYGDTNLFQWNSTNQVLDVTWDSTQPNSYYYHPLGATFTETDSFCVVFDLQLTDAVSFNSGSELAIGLLNFSEATNADFSRADSTAFNVAEFDYFPAYTYNGKPYPASEDATLIDASTNYFFAYDNVALNPGLYHVVLIHQAGTSTLSGEVFTNGQLMTALPIVYNGGTGAFQVDTLAIDNYADDGIGDSILAHGSVANFAFASPLPVGVLNTTIAGQVQFASDTNWLYTLEQTTDFQTWSVAAPSAPGTVTNLVLQATNLPVSQSFYRVSANLR